MGRQLSSAQLQVTRGAQRSALFGACPTISEYRAQVRPNDTTER